MSSPKSNDSHLRAQEAQITLLLISSRNTHHRKGLRDPGPSCCLAINLTKALFVAQSSARDINEMSGSWLLSLQSLLATQRLLMPHTSFSESSNPSPDTPHLEYPGNTRKKEGKIISNLHSEVRVPSLHRKETLRWEVER